MLDDPHVCGPAECLQCGNEWMAVWPLDCADLECPECQSTDTVRDAFPGVEQCQTT
jgi:predicted Zn-ribbon and HTH transcriptional regulator